MLSQFVVCVKMIFGIDQNVKLIWHQRTDNTHVSDQYVKKSGKWNQSV